MKGLRRILYCFIFAFGISVVAPVALFALEDTPRVVVVLHSYHEGFIWTDHMTEGIMGSLERFGESIDIRIEYLDAKRSPLTGAYAQAIKDYLQLKYAARPPALVLTTDNAAFTFAVAERDRIFGNAPLVFCGVNNYRPTMLAGQTGITGITEDPDLSGTLQLALAMTDAKHVVLIVDGTDTGLQNRLVAEEAIRGLDSVISTEYLDGRTLSFPELISRLKQIDTNSFVLFLDFFEDRLGNYHSIEFAIPQICEAASVPVFTHVDLYFGLGPVGGKMNRGFDQGHAAGILAGRILDGENVTSIPIETPSHARSVFDFCLLVKHHLLGRKLPVDTLIVNSPFSVINTYRIPIMIVAVSFVLLIVLLFVLLSLLAGRRKVEQELRASREGLNSIYNGVNDAILIHDRDTATIIDVNQAALDHFGYSAAEFKGMSVADISEDQLDNPGEQIRLLYHWIQAGERIILPWKSLRKNGSVFPSEVALRSASIGGKSVVIASIRDLTERQEAKEALERMLRDKETLLKEVHHRIKNNMTTIRGLLSLQIDAETNSSAKASLKNAESRVQSIILLYERLNMTDNYRELPVKEYLGPLSEEIVGSFPEGGKITIETEIDDCILNIQQLTPLGIIVNELITNMMKYAFLGRETGRIILSVTCTDKHLNLQVRDNGVGLPDSISFTNTTGFGMKIVAMLIEQIDGSIRIERGEGTAFIIDVNL